MKPVFFLIVVLLCGIFLWLAVFPPAVEARPNPIVGITGPASPSPTLQPSPAPTVLLHTTLPRNAPTPVKPFSFPTAVVLPLRPEEVSGTLFQGVNLYNLYVGKDIMRQPDPFTAPPCPVMLASHIRQTRGKYIDAILEYKDYSNTPIEGDKTAILALSDLLNAASEAGYKSITVRSSYRDYRLQSYLKEKKNVEVGVNLAPAGRSEHGLGTAFDLGWRKDILSIPLMYEDLEAASLYQWIKNNAHLYGFVISSPYKVIGDRSNGLEPFITEFMAEPWHIRYVTIPLATAVWEYRNPEGENYLSWISELVPQDFFQYGEPIGCPAPGE